LINEHHNYSEIENNSVDPLFSSNAPKHPRSDNGGNDWPQTGGKCTVRQWSEYGMQTVDGDHERQRQRGGETEF
jgi:hypothetical protein